MVLIKLGGERNGALILCHLTLAMKVFLDLHGHVNMTQTG